MTDVLILSDIMSEFLKVCLRDYGLDPKQYVSLPGFSWNSMLRMTKAKVQLLTYPDIHLFIESSIRGGVAVILGRHAVANNHYLPQYDSSKEFSLYSVHGRKQLVRFGFLDASTYLGFRVFERRKN